MSRTYTFLTTIIGVICGYVIIRHLFFFAHSMSVRNDVVQGFFVGFGWFTIMGCGLPSNSMLMRAACAQIFPGPVNVPQEAMYWTTSGDGAGHTLSGEHDYIVHFPAGGLPPNNAFWSLTMGDAKNRFVANPINRYSLGDRSGLAPNPDGSVDIYIQKAAPAGHESNWLPGPSGNFTLWLRVYIPGAAILDGQYEAPPVVEVK
jgi:hypothetical protein